MPVLKHIPEGLIFCACSICLRLDEEQIQRIKARYEVMIVPCYHARVNCSKGKKNTAKPNGKETIGKPWMPKEEQGRTITIPSCSDGRMTKSIENLRKFMDGQKIIADTWTSSRRSTPPTQPGTSGTGTKTPSYWYLMMISKLDRCEREKISSPPCKISQLFNENKDNTTLLTRRTKERVKDHSMKHWEQTWNGTANIRKHTGRKLPLLHLHNNSGKTNTKTLDFEINIGGKSDRHRLFHSHIDFSQISRSDICECRARGGRAEDRKPCRTHIFSQCRAL